MKMFLEFDNHLMNDNKPSGFFNEPDKAQLFNETFPFTLLGDLKKVQQSPLHHPEGNVWKHTMLVLDNAAERKHQSDNPRVLMWAALLHDLGKAPTTRIRKGKITSYDHDKVGEELSVKFLKELNADNEFIQQVSKMVRWHMQILFVVKGLPFAEVKKMASEVSIKEISILGLCDRLGRGEMTNEKQQEEERNIEIFLEKSNQYGKNTKL